MGFTASSERGPNLRASVESTDNCQGGLACELPTVFIRTLGLEGPHCLATHHHVHCSSRIKIFLFLTADTYRSRTNPGLFFFFLTFLLLVICFPILGLYFSASVRQDLVSYRVQGSILHHKWRSETGLI